MVARARYQRACLFLNGSVNRTKIVNFLHFIHRKLVAQLVIVERIYARQNWQKGAALVTIESDTRIESA